MSRAPCHGPARTILVVGASSGIGRAAATDLAARGHRVLGSSRDAAKVDADGVEAITLDVTDAESVRAALQPLVTDAAGIDAVVYSAGFYVAGSAEETSTELAAAQFEAYLLGAHRVVQAVLPAMRRRRTGRLVFMSSSAAVAAVPFHAFYSASKAALESYAEALRYEVAPLGVHVTCVQGTGVRTGAVRTARCAPAHLVDYSPSRESVIARFQRTQTDGPPASTFARALRSAVESPRPRPYYRVGPTARMLPLLRTVLPGPVFRPMFARSFDMGPPNT